MSKYINEHLDKLSRAFAALSNPHRLQIFTILSGCCVPGTSCTVDSAISCCVGDLGSKLNVASSTLSHHLKELNQAGLIDMRRDGKQIICSVNTTMLDVISDYFKANPEVKYES